MSDKIEVEMSSREATVTELYQLYSACKKRESRAVNKAIQELKRRNVKFKLIVGEGTTTLHLMSFHGNLGMVKLLVEMYGNADAKDENQQTPLHIACTKGYTDIVEYLINDCGCSPETKDESLQRTSLHWACASGHLEIVKYLANECRCNTEARDKLRFTPLYFASTKNYTEIVSYLIMEQGCDPEAEGDVVGESPMKSLYEHGELNVIKYCIKRKKHDPRTWKYYSLRVLKIIRPDADDHTQGYTCVIESPLLLACSKFGSLDVVKLLVEKYGLDPLERSVNTESDEENAISQLYYDSSKKEKVLHFAEEHGLDPITKGIKESDAENVTYTSMIHDSTEEKKEVLQLPDEVKAKLNSFTTTPLIQACESGRLDMLQYLISKCRQRVTYDHYHALIFIACKHGYSEIVRYLLDYSKINPNVEDGGNALLHVATTAENLKGAYETVIVLIASRAKLNKRNYLGETALHTVCKIHPCRHDIIELLLSSGCNYQISNFAGKTPLWVTQSSEVFKIFMRYSPADVCERILSDDINDKQSLELLECLIQQYNWNPNDTTKNGDTALHLACKADRLTMVKYLFSVDSFKYDPYAKNKLNQSPIELTSSKEIIRELIKHGNPIDLLINPVMDDEQVLQLVKEIDKDKLNGTTVNDNTALHLACLTDRTTIVRYLLRESKIDVNAKNVIDISPIQLTKNSEIIIELIRHGANPTDLYSYCRKVLGGSNLLQTTVKVFVMGDSNVGKSTLISSLKKEGWFSFLTSWLSTATTVAENAEPDHGIITHDFKSKQCGQIIFYDFVGKRLYHENQSDLLHETAHSPRVFIVVTNLSIGVDETISNLQYWLGFLEELSLPDSEFKNHTIIVGSNIDKCRNDDSEVRKIGRFIQERVSNISSMDYHDFIALDCCSHSSSDFTKLRRCLAKLCVIARNPQSLAFNAHCFQVYIMDKFKGEVAVSIHEILNKMREKEGGVDENDPLNFLPQSDFQLQNLCIELHNKGQILCLRDPTVNEMDFENSWLVIDKAVLISQLFEAFESITLKFKGLPSNNGILSFSMLSDLGPFKVYNSEMLIRFLCHLEYCKEISDEETLQAINAKSTSDRSFFFPVLVKNSAPERIWDGDADNFTYHCGWMLQCKEQEQFFTSKFLQILILRVMPCSSGANNSILLNFSLWKGGISWGNVVGAETIVEVLPNNKAVLFLMRCRDTNLAKCMEHRATIIHQIRKCAKEFCGNLKTSELLIFPSIVKKYPICSTPSELLYDIKPLAFAIVDITSVEQPYAYSLAGTNTIPIRDLLKFEPYMELSALTVQEICNVNNPRYISVLTDNFLLRFVKKIRNNSLFIGIFTQILLQYNEQCDIMDISADNLLSKLMEWRDTYDITYQQLQKCIGQFSIFSGLNILNVVPGLAIDHEEFSTPPSSPATPSPIDLYDIPQQLCEQPKLQDLDILKLRDGSEIRIMESVASEWDKLATKFGFEETRICIIREKVFRDIEEACFEMFKRWLNGEHGLKPPTWYNLIQCLKETRKFKNLARDVKDALSF